MAEKKTEQERVPALKITDNSNGETYELDFSRESIKFAENRGFEIDNVLKFPVTGVSDLFYYSFRMHNRRVARDYTDKLLERWGGLPESGLKRLINLYNQAMTANVIQTDEEANEKNAEVTMEL